MGTMFLIALFLAATTQSLVLATKSPQTLTRDESPQTLTRDDGFTTILTTLLVAFLSVGFVELLRFSTTRPVSTAARTTGVLVPVKETLFEDVPVDLAMEVDEIFADVPVCEKTLEQEPPFAIIAPPSTSSDPSPTLPIEAAVEYYGFPKIPVEKIGTMPASASSPRPPYHALNPPETSYPTLPDTDSRRTTSSASATSAHDQQLSDVDRAEDNQQPKRQTRARKGPKERARLRARREREQRERAAAAGQQQWGAHVAGGGAAPLDNWDPHQPLWVPGTADPYSLNASWGGGAGIRPNFSHPPSAWPTKPNNSDPRSSPAVLQHRNSAASWQQFSAAAPTQYQHAAPTLPGSRSSPSNNQPSTPPRTGTRFLPAAAMSQSGPL